MKRQTDLTRGEPGRLLLLFALPLLLGNLTQQLYTLVDTSVIGNRIGLYALSAIGSADRLIWLMQNLLIGLTAGFSVRAAILTGEGDRVALRRCVARSTLMTLFAAVTVAVLGELLASPLLALIRSPIASRPIALSYVRVIVLGLPVTGLYQLFSGVLRSTGDSKTPFAAMFATSLLNIGLDLFFIVVLKTGVWGAAAATILSQAVGGVWCFLALRRAELTRFTKEEKMPDPASDRTLLRLGLPVAAMNILIGLSGFAVQVAVNRHGDFVAAGMTTAEKLYAVLEIFGASLGYAAAAYAGQNRGANQPGRIRKGLGRGILLALAVSLPFTLLLLIAGDGIVGMMVRDEAGAEITFAVGTAHLRVIAIALPFVFLIILFRSTLQGVGNTLLPMAGGWAELVLRCIWALGVCPFVGEWGILYINVCAWVGSLAVTGIGCAVLNLRLKKEAGRSVPATS